MTGRRLSAPDRRAQLLEAARSCFVASGLDGTTMRAIGDAAGVNIALIYRHFGSKEELIEAAISEPLVEELDRALQTANEVSRYLGKPAVQRVLVEELMGRLLLTVADLTPALGVVLFSERGEQFFTGSLSPAIHTLAQAAAVSRPQWRKPRIDPEVIADMLLGACLMFGIRTMYGTVPVERSIVAQDFCDVIFGGVGVP